MKDIVISIILFVGLCICIFSSISFLNKTCKELENVNNNLEEIVLNEDWEKAYDNSIKLLDKWEKSYNPLSIFLNHEDLDHVNNELLQLTQYVKCKNKDESLATIHIIKFFLNKTIKMQKVNIENIL